MMPPRRKLPSPQAFGLVSFADLFTCRAPIPGEVPGSFQGFHAALMKDLGPVTPYETVLAENLIGIEWDLVQHRRMRDQAVRTLILQAIRDAVVAQFRKRYTKDMTAAQTAWCAAGRERREFKADPFDQEAAAAVGDELARRSVDPDLNFQSAAHAEVAALGLDVLDLMSDAYHTDATGAVAFHDAKIQEAERRRRNVKSDLNDLQKVRPIEAKRHDVTEAEVLER